MAKKKKRNTKKKCNPVIKPPKGKFIKASAVRFNRNGTVTVKVPGKAKNPRRAAKLRIKQEKTGGYYIWQGKHTINVGPHQGWFARKLDAQEALRRINGDR